LVAKIARAVDDFGFGVFEPRRVTQRGRCLLFSQFPRIPQKHI
jgi:hypothetical protein